MGTFFSVGDPDLIIGDPNLEVGASLEAETSLATCPMQWSSSISIRDAREAPLLGKVGVEDDASTASSFFFDDWLATVEVGLFLIVCFSFFGL